MCKDCCDSYICEICSVDGEHRHHSVLNLRPLVVDVMQNFEDNFMNFITQLDKIKESGVGEYRANINSEVE